jgi:hypothetical protein
MKQLQFNSKKPGKRYTDQMRSSLVRSLSRHGAINTFAETDGIDSKRLGLRKTPIAAVSLDVSGHRLEVFSQGLPKYVDNELNMHTYAQLTVASSIPAKETILKRALSGKEVTYNHERKLLEIRLAMPETDNQNEVANGLLMAAGNVSQSILSADMHMSQEAVEWIGVISYYGWDGFNHKEPNPNNSILAKIEKTRHDALDFVESVKNNVRSSFDDVLHFIADAN